MVGRMDLDVVFQDKAMRTPIFIKMDEYDQLLLSEGACQQLCILSYHEKVEQWRGGKFKPNHGDVNYSARVPMVKVHVVNTVRLLPHQSVVAKVKCIPHNNTVAKPFTKPLLMELKGDSVLQSEDVLFSLQENGCAHLMLSNPSGCSCVIPKGICLGEAVKVTDTVWPEETDEQNQPNASVRRVWPEVDRQRRSELLQQSILLPISLEEKQCEEVYKLLEAHHKAFSLDPQERGETNLIEMEISTDNAEPARQVMQNQ